MVDFGLDDEEVPLDKFTDSFGEDDEVVADTSIPEDKLDPKVQMDINESTASTREPIVNATDNGKPIDLNTTSAPGESKGLFGDFIASYRKRIGNVSQSIDENINTPFTPDTKGPVVGPDWLQRIGDVGGKVGSSALGVLDAGMAPVAAAGTAAYKDVSKIFTPDDATDKQKEALDTAAEDFGDVVAIPLTFKLPGESLGKTIKGKPNLKVTEEEVKLPELSQADKVEIESGLNKAKSNIENGKAIAKGAAEQKAAENVYKDSKTLRASLVKNKMELTPELYSKHIEEPVANAVNAGAPLDAIEASLRKGLSEAKLPEAKVNELVENSVGKFRAMQEASQERSLIPKGKDPFVRKESDPKVILPKQPEVINPSVVDDIPTANVVNDLPEPPAELNADEAIKATQATQTLKPSKEAAQVTADEVDKALNSTGTQLSLKVNNDLSPFYAISRIFSKKNGGKYFSGDNVVGDYRLARIANEREQGNKVLPGLIGTEDGAVKNIEQMTKEGLVVDNFDVKPYHTIQKEARDAGISTDKINEFRIAANALDDYNNTQNKVDAINSTIAKYRQAITTTDDAALKAKLEAAIKDKTKELKEVASNKTYEAYIAKDGTRVPLSKQRADQIFKEFSSTEAGKKYMEDMQKFSGHLLDMRVEAGLLSKAEAEAMKVAHPYYLSAQRDVENYADLQKFISGKGASTGIQARKGSSIDFTGDPVENTVLNIMTTARSTQRNRERQQMLEHLVEHLDDAAFSKVFRENKSDVLAAIQEAKHNPDASKIISATDITRTPSGVLENTGNFSVYYNGKRIDLTVKDTGNNAMYTSMTRPTMYDAGTDNALGKGLYDTALQAAQIKRNLLTTYNPIFNISSMIKESVGYMFTADGKAVGRSALYKPWKTFTTANNLRKDQEYYKYLRQNISPGVLYRDYQNVGGTDLINKISNSKNFYNQESSASKIAQSMGKPFKGIANSLEEFAQYSDLSTRARYYEDLKASMLKQGKSAEEAETLAIAGARRLGTNYQEQGASKIFNNWKAVTPFLKSRVNSLTKDFQALKYRPQQIAETVGVLAGVIYSVNKYNEQFGGTGNIDPKLRMNNIIVKTGMGANEYVMLPLPFQYFGNVASGAAEGLDNAFVSAAHKVVDIQDKAVKEQLKEYPNSNLSADDIGSLIFDAFTGQVSVASLMPVGVSTGLELYANKNYLGKEIEPNFLQNVEAGERTLPGKTSQAAIELGKKTGISPVKIDYIITSNLGGVGDVLTNASSMIVSAAKGKERPEIDLGQVVPGLSKFSGYGSKVPREGLEQQYSRLNSQIKEIDATLSSKKDKANLNAEARAEYTKYAQDHKELVNLYQTVIKPTNNHISNLYKTINRLQSGGDLENEKTLTKELLGDPKLKAKIDDLRNQINDSREKAMVYIKEHKDRYGDLWESRMPVNIQTDALLGMVRSNDPKKVSETKKPITNTKPIGKDRLYKILYPEDTETEMIIEPMSMPTQVMEQQAYDEEFGTNQEEPYKPSFFEKYTPGLRKDVVNTYRELIIDRTLKLEGGDKYTQHVENGKVTPTKFGVTLDTLKRENPNATAKDVRELTRDKAIAIYKDTYWDKAQVDKVPIGLQDLVFDGNINHGVPGMTKVVQRALNDLGAGLKVDGAIGNKTLNKLNEYPVAKVRAAILKRRKALYDQHPDNDKFGEGWNNRLSQLIDIPKEAQGA